MKQILIVGEKYSDNLGDGVICEVVNNYFSKKYKTNYFDLSGRIEYKKKEIKKFKYVESELEFIKNFIKKVLNIFRLNKQGNNISKIINKTNSRFDEKVKNNKPDCILFAGGQMFNDTFITQIEYICEYSQQHNIPVIFNACGIGNLNNTNIKKMKKILDMPSVKFISVRDGIEQFEEKTSKKIYDVYDTAIMSNHYYNVKKQTSNYIGFGMMLTYNFPVFIQILFWKKLLKNAINRDIKFKIFTNGSETDQSFVEYILGKLKLDKDYYLIEKPQESKKLMQIISGFNSIISMRLHSLIIAYSLYIPAIGISWDKKVKIFFSKINRDKLCFSIFSNPKKILDSIEYNNQYDIKMRNNIEKDIEINLEKINSLLIEGENK